MKHQLLFDEIDKFESVLRGMKKISKNKKEIIDTLLDLLIIAYVFGNDDANDFLKTEIEVNTEEMKDTIYEKIAEKNFEERVGEYVEFEDVDGLMRVAETEGNRIYNDSVLTTARKTGKEIFKTWITMRDEKVRDTHFYLDALTIPLEDRFYTFDGDSALYPCGFEYPENNCNCRCHIKVSL